MLLPTNPRTLYNKKTHAYKLSFSERVQIPTRMNESNHA